jgi:hypothetical protein
MLVKCKECGREVSNTAAACPNCGAKPKQPTSGCTQGCTALGLLTIVAIIVGSVANYHGETNTLEPSDEDKASATKWGVSLDNYMKAKAAEDDAHVSCVVAAHEQAKYEYKDDFGQPVYWKTDGSTLTITG